MMQIIVPIRITADILTSTTLAESTLPSWDTTTTYNDGDQVQRQKNGMPHIFTWSPPAEETTKSRKGIDPAEKSVSTISEMSAKLESTAKNYLAYWLDLGAVNRWAMFDSRSQHKSTAGDDNGGTITLTLTPGELCNGIALIDVEASELSVSVSDPMEGEGYHRNINMLSLSEIIDYWSWFFLPTGFKEQVVLTDLPTYNNAEITVTISNTYQPVRVGELVTGQVVDVGALTYGTKIKCYNFSRKGEDEKGVATLVRGRNIQQVQYDVSVKTYRIAYLKRVLGSLINTPAVFTGHEDHQATVVYGNFTEFTLAIEGYTLSECSITVEEIV